jgi:glycerol-3-phosphate acyltransferase PlsY
VPNHSIELLQIVAGFFCVLGNTFPVWLRFRGGKGVATSAGLLFGLTPLAVLCTVVIWLVTFKTTRYVSVASITAALALPVMVFILMRFMHSPGPLVLYVSIGLTAVVILRHRSNISRLLRGTEERFQKSED